MLTDDERKVVARAAELLLEHEAFDDRGTTALVIAQLHAIAAPTALATGTVQEMVQRMPVVEWRLGPDWYQLAVSLSTGRPAGTARWRHENAANWSSWGQPLGDIQQHLGQLARLVPAFAADVQPAARGPLIDRRYVCEACGSDHKEPMASVWPHPVIVLAGPYAGRMASATEWRRDNKPAWVRVVLGVDEHGAEIRENFAPCQVRLWKA